MTHKNNPGIPGNVWEGESKARLNFIIYMWEKRRSGRMGTYVHLLLYVYKYYLNIFSEHMLFYNKNDHISCL